MVRECHWYVAALSCWEAKVLESPTQLVVTPAGASVPLNKVQLLSYLPYDGIVEYVPSLFGEGESSRLFEDLLAGIPWQQDEVILFGQKKILSRKVAWMGDAEFTYSYSGTSKVAAPWTPALLTIKERVESECGHQFNSCLLNLYHDGSEGMGWHSDDEKTLGKDLQTETPQVRGGRLCAPRGWQSAGDERSYPASLGAHHAQDEEDHDTQDQPHLP